MTLIKRLRRIRQIPSLRQMVAEHALTVSDLVMPVFVSYRSGQHPIDSLPGLFSYGVDDLDQAIQKLVDLKLVSCLLFPIIDPSDKTDCAKASYDEKGLIPQAILRIKKRFPDFVVMTDLALDPYTLTGHDGLVHEGKVLNDETVDVLCQQAITYAQAGADVLAPSDMMDGRVLKMRGALDEQGFQHTVILSYAAKYASAFYGPFRGALDSALSFGDKKTYQMNAANQREAILEGVLDMEEGADILMVKPAGYYLDIIKAYKQRFLCPIAAYHVSGEYVMVKLAAQQQVLDEKSVFLEMLTGIKRAGADIIISYASELVAQWILEDEK